MAVYQTWRAPSREEFPAGVSELRAVIGDEANDPSWTRRLVLVEGDAWALLVEECGQLPPYHDQFCTGFPVAYLLVDGVAKLQGPDNPEGELARRRAEKAAAAARAEEAQRQKREAAQLAAEEARQLEKDKREFQGDSWDKLPGWRQLGFSLALAVEKRDPSLASDLRALASQRMLDFPRCRWW